MTQYDFNRNVLEIIGDICCRLEADPSVRVKYSDLVTRIGNITRAQSTEAARDAYAFERTGEYAPVPDEDAAPPDHDPPSAEVVNHKDGDPRNNDLSNLEKRARNGKPHENPS